MRDAFGGIVNITMIVVFLVVVSGYMAFNVTYTKAFRMKNEIIRRLEQYEGNCNESGDGVTCLNAINDYAKSIGYNLDVGEVNVDKEFPGSDGNGNGYCSKRGYCWARYSEDKTSGVVGNNKVYYKVKTKIVIEIPILQNIMENVNFFTLTGNTRLINGK